jgi:hypothetical protein
MIGNRQQQAIFQSDFYRHNYHKVLNGLIFYCFIILLLIAAIIYFVLLQPSTPYYGTSLSGQIIAMAPTAPT